MPLNSLSSECGELCNAVKVAGLHGFVCWVLGIGSGCRGRGRAVAGLGVSGRPRGMAGEGHGLARRSPKSLVSDGSRSEGGVSGRGARKEKTVRSGVTLAWKVVDGLEW